MGRYESKRGILALIWRTVDGQLSKKHLRINTILKTKNSRKKSLILEKY